jgi:hypothetical protein
MIITNIGKPNPYIKVNKGLTTVEAMIIFLASINQNIYIDMFIYEPYGSFRNRCFGSLTIIPEGFIASIRDISTNQETETDNKKKTANPRKRRNSTKDPKGQVDIIFSEFQQHKPVQLFSND